MSASRGSRYGSRPWTAILAAFVLATSWIFGVGGTVVAPHDTSSLPQARLVAAVAPAQVGIVTGYAQACEGPYFAGPIPTVNVIVSVTQGLRLVALEEVAYGSDYWLSVPSGTYQVSATNVTRVGVPRSNALPRTTTKTVSVTGGKVTVGNMPSVCALD